MPASGRQARNAQFSFDWQLAGDPEIMPLQVFDDGVETWLQFAPEGAWPAVFQVSAHGWQPLSYRREPPYMVLDGVYEHLELRGGHLQGSVRRERAVGQAPAEAVTVLDTVGAVEAVVPAQAPERVAQPAEPPLQLLAPEAVPGVGPLLMSHYAVSPADLTIRQALERWARTSGWMFSAEHWAVDVDIPLVGEASFDTDFKSAVRELLAATEMGDRPLQPCFYSNRVLRVVPHAQACDRRGGMRALS